MMSSQVARVREEMKRMALGVHCFDGTRWCERTLKDWYPRLKRATAAKRAPKRPARSKLAIIENDMRVLHAVMLFSPAKTNVEIGNHLGIDPGRVSECMTAALVYGQDFAEGLKYLRLVVKPALERGDKDIYRRWQRAKKT